MITTEEYLKLTLAFYTVAKKEYDKSVRNKQPQSTMQKRTKAIINNVLLSQEAVLANIRALQELATTEGFPLLARECKELIERENPPPR